MKIVNICLDFLDNPKENLSKIMKEKNIGLGFLGYLLGAFMLSIFFKLKGSQIITFNELLSATIGLFILMIAIGYFLASSAHLLLDMTTGKGSAAGLFTLIGISHLVEILLLPFVLLGLSSTIIMNFSALFVLFVFILQLLVILYMMEATYGLSKTSTFFALIFSLIPAIISVFVISIAFLFGSIALISSMF